MNKTQKALDAWNEIVTGPGEGFAGINSEWISLKVQFHAETIRKALSDHQDDMKFIREYLPKDLVITGGGFLSDDQAKAIHMLTELMAGIKYGGTIT